MEIKKYRCFKCENEFAKSICESYDGLKFCSEECLDLFEERHLKIMFNRQEKFQKQLKNDVKSQEFINTTSLALMAEILEALNETKWKPWKKQQVFNSLKFKDELVDCWHFLINLTLSSGMPSKELFDKFIKKNDINFKRQEENY